MPSTSEVRPWRVLVALLVYNGEELVVPCLSSLASVDPSPHSVDVLILDDASPAPGWSERCHSICQRLGFDYYRSPRNLGIPRNMNLGLLWTVECGYDAVILLNADTLVPTNLIPSLIEPLRTADEVSSVTAWSNNVSIYSLPNDRPEIFAAAPDLVDWVSSVMEEEFGGQTIVVPSGVGFCMAIPARMIKQVGIMDPLFGRGYSEEIDWCLRSHSLGYRSLLAPSCYVYHAGSGINKKEGLVGGTNQLMSANHDIIDIRYPLYSAQIDGYWASSLPRDLGERGCRAVVTHGAREHGYRLDVGWLQRRPNDQRAVCFRVDPAGDRPVITGSYLGFEWSFSVESGDVLGTLDSVVGLPPQEVRIHDQGRRSADMVGVVQDRSGIQLRYPYYNERVL